MREEPPITEEKPLRLRRILLRDHYADKGKTQNDIKYTEITSLKNGL